MRVRTLIYSSQEDCDLPLLSRGGVRVSDADDDSVVRPEWAVRPSGFVTEANAVYGSQCRIDHKKCCEFSYPGSNWVDYNRGKFRSF